MNPGAIQEFLTSEDVVRKIQRGRDVIRSSGGTGKILIELDIKDDRFRGGGLETQISSGRIPAKHYTPE